MSALPQAVTNHPAFQIEIDSCLSHLADLIQKMAPSRKDAIQPIGRQQRVLNEAQVKAIVLSRIRASSKRHRNPIVTAEFTLGRSGARADLVIFGRQCTGFEIKTEQDSLRRLPHQLEAYAKHFNRVIIVVAKSHLRSLNVYRLAGAGLWVFDESGVIVERHPGINNVITPEILDRLLTKNERGRLNFREAMSERYNHSSSRFWQSVAHRPIRADDIPHLSRFSEARATARLLLSEKTARWSAWLSAQGITQPNQSSSVSSAAVGLS